MSPNTPSEATVESLRPSSVWTNDSTFADSAISMDGDRTGTSTPKQFEDDHLELRSPSSSHNQTLSERLTQLAAVAWAAEQDGFVDDVTKDRIFRSVTNIETSLEDRVDYTEQEELEANLDRRNVEREHAEDVAHLTQIHEHLAATVTEMRQRQQEQRHIHELTIRKLEDVAGTCAAQEQQMRNLQAEIEALKIDNQKLYRDNDGFQAHAEQLTSELQQKDIALQAMSSAVAGLDGWISNSLTPERGSTRRVRATRGRGRFQTHYYVDVPIENTSHHGLDGTVDAREVRDGLTAWVRGFRDVEEAMSTNVGLQTPSRQPKLVGRNHAADRFAPSVVTEEEDWGDFQTVSSTREYNS